MEKILQWLDRERNDFITMARDIWLQPELAYQETYATQRQSEYLAQKGFRVDANISGMPTAFIAEWGRGNPVIGFVGEYDALGGLSQAVAAEKEPILPGGAGHGCGHNLLGTGCLAAAAAVKTWMEESGISGRVRYYGCPAEEQGNGKVFMARDGHFDDLDAAFNFHPFYINMAMKSSMVGVREYKFRFHGRSAHAGAAPHLGRSGLDAVELMNVGVNYLREHVASDVRIHYVITKGGEAPNIVPVEGEVWYFIRARDPDVLEDVVARVIKVAQGAALMTETDMDPVFIGGVSPVFNHPYLADLQYQSMKEIGKIRFSEEEFAFARKLSQQFPDETREANAKAMGIPVEFFGQDLIPEPHMSHDEGFTGTGSTDVGDLSWKAPVSMLSTACWPTGVPGHTWGIVAASGSSMGMKGMIYAAKVMALSAVKLFVEPEHLKSIRAIFNHELEKHPYQCPIPRDFEPPVRAGE
jgi:aminobenzoyl-glutamate utilization protein B